MRPAGPVASPPPGPVSSLPRGPISSATHGRENQRDYQNGADKINQAVYLTFLVGAGLLSCDFGGDLNQVSIRVTQQGGPVVVTDRMRRLHHRHPHGCPFRVCLVDVAGPHDQDHGRTARGGLDTVDAPGRFDCAQRDREPVQAKLDVLGNALGGVRNVSVKPRRSR